MKKLSPAEIKTILEGTMLVFDPTSGGRNSATGEQSLAGWASFSNTKLMESGTLAPTSSKSVAVRLRSICNTLQTEFSYHDIMIVEDINTTLGHKSLLNSVGAYIVGTQSAQFYEVNISAWQSFAKKLGGWAKGDESDAIYMGWYMIAYAKGWNSKGTKEHKEEMITHMRGLRDE